MSNSPKLQIKQNHKTQRVFTFIDGSNFEKSVKELGFTSIDYKRLYSWLTCRLKSSKIFFYGGEQQGDETTINKHKLLKSIGYKTRIKKAQIYKNNPKFVKVTCKCGKSWIEQINMGYRTKANCDVTLTFDSMRNMASYEAAVFFTGDGDFFDLLEYLVNKKRKITIISTGFKNKFLKRTSLIYKSLLRGRKITFIDLKLLPPGILVK